MGAPYIYDISHLRVNIIYYSDCIRYTAWFVQHLFISFFILFIIFHKSFIVYRHTGCGTCQW